MMKNKILYIGLTENKQITNLKDKLDRFVLKEKYNRENDYSEQTIIYLDNNRKQQLRKETWEQVGIYTYRIINIHSVKNDLQEGESISLLRS